MKWNDHSRDVPEGAHAFLGASKYSWLNYDENRLITAYQNYLAIQRGTVLHSFACQCIKLKQKLPKSQKTLNMHVNDAIGFRMTPEQVLYYSPNCFGTTDAIKFEKDLLRIHDLKTGSTPASFKQLEIYAALFCLEYRVDPLKIQYELRIYQNDEVLIENPSGAEIEDIMRKIIVFDEQIDKLKGEPDVL